MRSRDSRKVREQASLFVLKNTRNSKYETYPSPRSAECVYDTIVEKYGKIMIFRRGYERRGG